MEECPWWVRACNNMRARGAKEVEVAYPATSVCTLFRHIDPHQIPFKFGGLSILPTDISVGHNSSMLALKPGEDKSIEITCEQACTVHFLFRSSGVPLSYQISLIPGTFEWIKEDQTTFVPTGDDGALIRFERRWAYCGGLTTEVVKVKRPIKVVCSIRNSIDQESSFFLFKYHVVF
ncbi:PREDICTED: patellin-3-like [Camelina sativa]|uniref:Patellin-3-like n=1 Tax=Camelina sativa TaxID=90675 RepID=A0ABM1RCN6_CAMSA|nr:PREDICTED: patellin-3-like [Camelina sativa]